MENSSYPTKKGWRFWLPIVCFVIGLFSIFSGLAGCNDHITVHLPERDMTVTVPVEPTEADKSDSVWGGIIWCGVSYYAFRKLNRKTASITQEIPNHDNSKTGHPQNLTAPQSAENPKQSVSFSESKMANALASDGAWVGGTVLLTKIQLSFKPNGLNSFTQELTGIGDGVSFSIPLSEIKSLSIEDAPFTKIVVVNTDAKTFKFRCYGAKEFLEKLKTNTSARG